MERQSWLNIERGRYATNEAPGEYDLRVVDWTVRTALSTSIENLAPCLLETFEPREALLRWVAHTSESAYSDIMPILADGKRVEFYKSYNQFLHPLVFPLVEHVSQHTRDAQLGMNFWKERESTAMTQVVHWLSFDANTNPDNLTRGWAYWSQAITGFDPVKLPRDASIMIKSLLKQYQRRERPGIDEPVTSAFHLSFWSVEEILTMLFSECLVSITTSDWLPKLGQALGLQGIVQASVDMIEVDVYSDRYSSARAFEHVAVATIEDIIRTESKQHAPGLPVPELEGGRWKMIKGYLQHFRLAVYDTVHDEEHWFKALDKLLECTPNPSTDLSFSLTRDEARDLVSLYMVPRKAQAYDEWISSALDRLKLGGHPCSHLKEYLVECNLL